MKVVVFLLGGEQFALDVERVREIVSYVPPRRLPTVEAWHLGVVAVREEILPVWDTAVRLGLPQTDAPRALLVVDGAVPLALVVEDVVGIRELPADSLRSLPQWSEARGVAVAGEELVVVLDADRLLGQVVGVDELDALPKRELQRLARDAGIAGRSRMNREQLLAALRRG
jgi:purine-binding chemotaxis protein CheW